MDYLVNLLILFSIYGILAISLNLLVGYTGLISMAHVAFYGIGAYALALLTTYTPDYLAKVAPAPLLELTNVHAGYDGKPALHGVNLVCHQGQIVTILGPNGAGKSTVLKTIFGLLPAKQGSMTWQGVPISPNPHRLVANGLSFAPQGKSVFPNLTVRENLETGVHFVSDTKDVKNRLEEMLALFPALQTKLDQPAGKLSGGQRQMVVLARGLMTRPKLLLLDEPSLGLSPKIVREVFARIQEINQRLGTAFIIVEHNLKSLLSIVDHAYILTQGRVLAAGKPTDPTIQQEIHNIFKL
jgi:branched-chain amino acid transport system ATP-binding protein